MSKKIKWEDSFEKIGTKRITEVEAALGIVFPQDYVECAMKNHGGYPSLDTFDFEGHQGAVFNSLLGYDSEEEPYILDVYNDVKDRLIPKIVPFADDPFGNLICFDYRMGNDISPKIVFWNHEIASQDREKAITFICNTFTELLSKLYEEE